MASVDENIALWTNYDWSRRGDEWSNPWGGSEMAWLGTIFPRIAGFLPAVSALEIAPGFGRFTRYLKDHCERLTIVDVTPRCIEACKQRFASFTHITYVVNEGTSLEAVADRSIDFAFSYDSLVHCEADVMRAYLRGLAAKLAPNGVAFLHHSNLASFAGRRSGRTRYDNRHGRAPSVCGDSVIQDAAAAGLCCFSQERINWLGAELTDCFSLLTPAGSRHERPARVLVNRDFTREAEKLGELARLYSADANG